MAFHASFDNDAVNVAQSTFGGCIENIMYLSPTSLNAAVYVLKSIGFEDKSRELLEKYMKEREAENIFDLSNYVFRSDITDPDIIKAFNEKAEQVVKVLPTPLEAASRIYRGGWSEKDEEALAKLSVDDLIELFKATKGTDRSVIILGCLKFRKVGNATPRQKAIADNARTALEKIASESPLNAQRMRAFNISVEAEKPKSPSAEASPID